MNSLEGSGLPDTAELDRLECHGPTLDFLGHAGCLVSYRGIKLLCDPWVSECGAFLHAWHQYPPNDFLDQARLHEADFLFISHDHADHLDRAFLASFPKDKVTVLVADFPTDQLVEEISELGFPRIERLADWEPFALGDGFQVRAIRDQSLFKTDSVLMAEAGPIRFVDRNDCHLTAANRARLRELGVDLLLLQFSGAMWYPAAYQYPPQKQRQIAAELRAGLLDKFIFRTNSIAPRHVIHAAGPPCFLDDELQPLNHSKNSIFHDQQEVFEELQSKISPQLHLLAPGDRVGFTQDGDLHIERPHPFDFSAKDQTLTEYRQRRLPMIDRYLAGLPKPEAGFLQRFKRHLGALFGSSKLLRARANLLVRFEIAGTHGGVLYVDTRDGRFTITEASSGPAAYEFFLDGPIARLLVDGVERWEEVLLSMRFRARREPDEYNWPLFALLRYGHDQALIRRIEQLLVADTDATMEVRDGVYCYTVQRYCPHSGEDLMGVPIEDGKLICPRHRWAFDLRRHGECVSGGNIPLKIYEQWEDEEREGEV